MAKSKIINYKFRKFNSYNNEEKNACSHVIASGLLSGFVGNRKHGYDSGPYVKKLERAFEKFFKVKYAISVNSWTSGLICALGAINIEPGDEVILPTWTMSSCSAAILHWNAIPVFADISPLDFNIDPLSINKLITKKTKAILAVDIFGKSANYNSILKIAKKNNLKVICDTAQAPGCKYNKKFAGTLGDIGGYSLNYHKHIHTGEGGVVVTNNFNYAKKIKLIRNHAEAVVGDNFKKKNLINMIGYNFRMGEIEAAIGLQQIKKLKDILRRHIYYSNYLIKSLKNIPHIKIPDISKNFSNVFYGFPIILEDEIFTKYKVTRKKILKLLISKGIPGINGGYQNLHLLPIYKNKIAFGKSGHPWTTFKSKVVYKKGICPIAEKLHSKSFISFPIAMYHLTRKDVMNIKKCFSVVWQQLGIIKNRVVS